MWGGGTASERFNECWIYNVQNDNWSQGTIPDEVDLYLSKAATDGQGTTWVYGGIDETSALRDDFYKVENQGEETEEWSKYNWETFEWQKIGGRKPTLTLGKAAVQYEPICPYCENCTGSGSPTEKTIANLSISVDDLDGWQVTSIGFNAWGSGKDDQYIKEVRLYVNGGLTGTGTYTSDNGAISLSIGKHLQAGETINLKLTYVFNFPYERSSNHYSEFGVTTSVALVSAIPDTYLQYFELPSTVFSCGPQLVAPVENVNTGEYFATIQEGIDAENTKDGHTIQVCPGVYTENITVNKSLTLQSREGCEATYISTSDNTKNVISVTKPNSTISGFTISNACGEGTSGISITQSGCTIYHNKLELNYAGIDINGATSDAWANDCFIKNNIITENEYGVVVEGYSLDNTIGGSLDDGKNIISKNKEAGILLCGENTLRTTITGNLIGTNSEGTEANGNGYGIYISNGSAHNQIGQAGNLANVISGNNYNGISIKDEKSEYNSVEGNYIGTGLNFNDTIPNQKYGIQISDKASRNKVGDSTNVEALNYIHNNLEGGILISGEETDTIITSGNRYNKICQNSFVNNKLGIKLTYNGESTLVYKNTFTSNNTYGINIDDYGYSSIIGNTISKQGEEGIFLSYSCIIKIANNEIYENRYGLRSWKSDTSIQIIGNNFYKNSNGGLRIEHCNNISMNNNMIYENAGTGISILQSGSKGRIEITQNKNYNNTYGIYLNVCDSIIIKGNEIYENSGYGLYSWEYKTGFLVTDNKIFKNKDGGVLFQESFNASSCEVSFEFSNNEIYENEKNGIYLNKSSSSLINGNKIYGNKQNGIYLINSRLIWDKNCGDTNNVYISDNDIYENGESGVFLETSNYPILNNRIYANKKHGIIYYIPNNASVQEHEYNYRKYEEGICRNDIYNNGDMGICFDCKSNEIIEIFRYFKIYQNKIYANNSIGLYINNVSALGKAGFLYNTPEIVEINGNNIYSNALGIRLFNTAGMIIKENTITNNKEKGIFLDFSCYCKSSNNNILSNGTGIDLQGGHSSIISNNKILDNCRGVLSSVCENTTIANNTIKNSYCVGTGIHITGESNSKITGNKITGDAGAAIHCENGANPLISKNELTDNDGNGILCESGSVPIVVENNIYGNGAYGLENTDESVTIEANNNWWGNASGTTGQTLGNVTATTWKNSLVELVACTHIDTVYTAPGKRDSIYCSVRKWSTPYNEVVDVSIQATELSWVIGGTAYSLALNDTLGADTLFYFQPPESATDGASNKIFFTATSQSDTDLTSTDSVVVMTYHPYLASMKILPDSTSIMQGDSLYFYVEGTDQKEKSFSFEAEWTASSGSINTNGYFKAGNQEELVYITATDSDSQQSVTALIQVVSETPETDTIIVSPDSVTLNPGETVQFSTRCYDQYGMKTEPSLSWETTGGNIDASGYFVAGDEAGTFTVTANTAGIYGQAIVIVEEIQYSLTLGIEPSNASDAGCTVSQSGNGTYEEGETATLTATPANEWIFTGWTGSSTSTDNPLELIMDGDKTLTANFELLNAIGQPGQNNEICFYPNPVSGILTIDLPQNARECHLKIFDMTGKIVLENANFSKGYIDLSRLAKGSYLIYLQHGNNTYKELIVKN